MDYGRALEVYQLSAAGGVRVLVRQTGVFYANSDVRLVQEVLGHANLSALHVYTAIVDSRKEAAYERYGEFLRTGLHG